MKNLEETYGLVYWLNEEAHSLSYDIWKESDDLMDEDWEAAEELREDASIMQSTYFREQYLELSNDDKESIIHWLKNDEDFKDEFTTFFGETEFENNFKL